jgi:hypothetical protein
LDGGLGVPIHREGKAPVVLPLGLAQEQDPHRDCVGEGRSKTWRRGVPSIIELLCVPVEEQGQLNVILPELARTSLSEIDCIRVIC